MSLLTLSKIYDMKKLGLYISGIAFLLGVLCFIFTFQVLITALNNYLFPEDRLLLFGLLLADFLVVILFSVGFYLAYGESPIHSELSAPRLKVTKNVIDHTCSSVLKLEFGVYLGYLFKIPLFLSGGCFLYFFTETFQSLDIIMGLFFITIGVFSFFMKKRFYWDKENRLFMFSGELFDKVLIKRVFEAPDIHKIYLDIEKHVTKSEDENGEISEGKRTNYYEIQLNTSIGYVELWGEYRPQKVKENLKLMQEYAKS